MISRADQGSLEMSFRPEMTIRIISIQRLALKRYVMLALPSHLREIRLAFLISIHEIPEYRNSPHGIVHQLFLVLKAAGDTVRHNLSYIPFTDSANTALFFINEHCINTTNITFR